MFVTLQIKSGAGRGKKALVREGQVLQVGRTEWADFAVEGDNAMGEVHFVLECLPEGCRLRDLKTGSETAVNGEPVTETMLSHGDEIKAGRTTFSVSIEGAEDRTSLMPVAALAAAEAAAAAAEEAAGPKESGFARVAEPSAAKLVEDIKISDPAEELLQPDQNVRTYFEALVAAKLFPDAMAVLARGLGKQEAVWWCVSVRNPDGTPKKEKARQTDEAAWQAAEAWVLDPSEDARQACGKAAKETGLSTSGGWAAQAAFLNSGSMLPPNLPPLPPPDAATGKAASTSLMLSATAGDGAKLFERYQATIDQGVLIADGQNLWEGAEADSSGAAAGA